MLPRWLYEILPWIYLMICALGLPAAAFHPAAILFALVIAGATGWILWMRHEHRLRPRRTGLHPHYYQ